MIEKNSKNLGEGIKMKDNSKALARRQEAFWPMKGNEPVTKHISLDSENGRNDLFDPIIGEQADGQPISAWPSEIAQPLCIYQPS